MDKPMKKIADQKLKAFTIGSMGNRSLSKRELDELKKKEQEKAAAQVFEEFVATFDNAPASKVSKTWIKAGTYDAGKRQEDAKEKGKIYRPQPKIEIEKSSAQRAEEYAKQLERKERPKKKKEGEKKKTNLELFKEELKLIQEEREERHKYKGAIKSVLEEQENCKSLMLVDDVKVGSYDTGDPNTTNLYLGNLNPKITEQELMELFGKYGPLASIKIMWPRSDEEKARGRNCGFVAYMSRKDGERALRCLNGKDVMQYEMKLGWGKGVPIPSFPIYIPSKMLAVTMPPPFSGLPFNAQPSSRDKHRLPKKKSREEYTPEEEEKIKKVTQQSVVKVVIPTDRNILTLIHHMIEFVIREGPMFEAMIMNREINNPLFSFLFENQSPTHIYYRWKLFSMLQGDSPKEWRTEEFYMFKGGSVWRPPPISPFSNGMPDELFEDEVDLRKGSLSITQRERLEDLLRYITPERTKIAEAMIFCVEHVGAIDEICDCIVESVTNAGTLLYKKVARLYLISDILNNCLNKITNASYFRIAFESRLIKVFEGLYGVFDTLDNPNSASSYRTRVLRMLKLWGESFIYPKEFIKKLENIFLGAPVVEDISESEPEEPATNDPQTSPQGEDTDIDGAPLSENGEDIDGVPLDGAALLKAMKQSSSTVDDIDGIPLNDDDIDGVPVDDDSVNQTKLMDRSSAFVPSRWESVDPQEAAAQAMTTSKWELLEQANASSNSQNASTRDTDSQNDDNSRSPSPALSISATNVSSNAGDNSSTENERRAKLREVEVKVMQYQDELESGKRSLKPGATVPQQVEHYRRKLIRKIEKQKLEKKERESEKRSPSCEEEYTVVSRKGKRSRTPSKSPQSKRHSRSRSPVYKSHKSWSPSKTSKRKVSSPSPRRKRRAVSPDSSPTQRDSRHRGDSPVPRPRSKHRSRRSESYSPVPSSSRHRRHSRGYSPSSTSSPPSRRHKYKYKR